MDALRAYYTQVMEQHFLPTRRVRRKLVDTGYLEGRIPATSPPPFEVAKGVRCMTACARPTQPWWPGPMALGSAWRRGRRQPGQAAAMTPSHLRTQSWRILHKALPVLYLMRYKIHSYQSNTDEGYR